MLNITRARNFAVAFLTTLLVVPAFGQDNPPEPLGSRWDLSLDLPVWPALVDLQPMAGGSFRSTGFGLGISGHFPVREFSNSELLVGGDLSFAATDSSISLVAGDMLARQMYLGVSAKWLFGESRNVSLDAGVGYHEVDIAYVNSEWWGSIQTEFWGKERVSGFVGAIWDIGAARAENNSGLFVGLRVHLADFGPVYDAQYVGPILGPAAGNLDGPMYMIRVGYSGR